MPPPEELEREPEAELPEMVLFIRANVALTSLKIPPPEETGPERLKALLSETLLFVSVKLPKPSL
jgi:hypothetical protein